MRRTQHPSNNDVLGAPPGMTVEECNALPITRIDYPNGLRAVASYWQPTQQEIALLVKGMPVRLLVLGDTHPPLLLGVDGDGEL
jgi:hypothetical protein